MIEVTFETRNKLTYFNEAQVRIAFLEMTRCAVYTNVDLSRLTVENIYEINAYFLFDHIHIYLLKYLNKIVTLIFHTEKLELYFSDIEMKIISK